MKARSSATVGEPAPAGSGYFIPHKLVMAKKYYYAGSQRVAMRSNGTLFWLFGDHLGSTSVAAAADGTKVSETRYKAWGEVRYSSSAVPTKYGYTGQYSYVSDFGLMFYNARWYDPALGRFTQADTIVPEMGNPAAFDRYAYVYNRPVIYTDPSGKQVAEPSGVLWVGSHISADLVRADGTPVPVNTSFAQSVIDDNACGPICVAAVLGLNPEDVFTDATTLGATEKGVKYEGDSTNSAAVVLNSDGSFPPIDTEQLSALINQQTGWTSEVFAFSQWENDAGLVTAQIAQWLAQGLYPIVLVNIAKNSKDGSLVALPSLENDGTTTGHYVVITGIGTGIDGVIWVRIYNPYNHRAEYYTWDDFWNSWGAWGTVETVTNEDGEEVAVKGHYRKLVVPKPRPPEIRYRSNCRNCLDRL